MTSILESLIPRLRVSEGFSEHVYVDTTSNLTIAYGHNLAQVTIVPSHFKEKNTYEVQGGRIRLLPVNGIERKHAELILIDDVTEVIGALTARLPWFSQMDDVRREVLIELCFNIGLGVLSYKVFMGQLARKEYAAAADNMRGWRWVQQVHESRALPLIAMMETGKRPRP